ncbi:MAG: V-type ATPase subunit subunit G family protein [Candidatus Bathyarchaeia archaeon]
MERVLTLSERLQRILEEAEKAGELKIEEARKRAEEMITRAKEEAENRRIRAQRGDGIEDLTRAEEEKAKLEAARILEEYRARAENLRRVPEERFKEAVELILREVIPR